jgi:hypothetical protein
VWLGIRAGAVGLHPCSAKPRSASHRLGCRRLVRPVDSKLRAFPLKPRESVLGRAFLQHAAPASSSLCHHALPPEWRLEIFTEMIDYIRILIML